ncbi:MAG: hypothetical protein LBB34_04020 [Holosporales bacterium]|jgi:hypothetical protein|nr:hypothetical protein [Holosporales bacterium]
MKLRKLLWIVVTILLTIPGSTYAVDEDTLLPHVRDETGGDAPQVTFPVETLLTWSTLFDLHPNSVELLALTLNLPRNPLQLLIHEIEEGMPEGWNATLIALSIRTLAIRGSTLGKYVVLYAILSTTSHNSAGIPLLRFAFEEYGLEVTNSFFAARNGTQLGVLAHVWSAGDIPLNDISPIELLCDVFIANYVPLLDIFKFTLFRAFQDATSVSENAIFLLNWIMTRQHATNFRRTLNNVRERLQEVGLVATDPTEKVFIESTLERFLESAEC